MSDKNTIMCRCEDVDLEKIRAYLDQGFTSFEDLKRLLRVGMGPCQGSTCIHLITQEISKVTGQPIERVKSHRIRPFLSGVLIKDLVGEDND
ncbi:MAG: (2Fe-2S)-binding protein [Erysipelothrix sp.]|nr:(2Fe-2S)-binding protein [Erysipelothrix sp.]